MQFSDLIDSHKSLSAAYSRYKGLSVFSAINDVSKNQSLSKVYSQSSFKSTGNSNNIQDTPSSIFSDTILEIDNHDANQKLKKHLRNIYHYLMRSSIYSKNRRRSIVPIFKTSRRVWKPNDLKSIYQYVKDNATNYIIMNMILQLTTIFNKAQDNVNLDILPHQLFSWNRDHFIERCSLTDFVYIDILNLNFNKKQLFHLKFIKDLSELIRYCTRLHHEYFMRKSNWQIIIQKELLDAADLANMEAKLTSDYNDFTELQMLFKYKISDVAYRFFETYDSQRSYTFKLEALDSKVIRSIEYRYETGMLAAEAEFLQYSENMKLNALQDEIKYYNDLIHRDEQCHQIELKAIKIFHGNYMDKLDFWSKKCETESDFADEEIIMLRFRIAQAEESYKRMEKLLARSRAYKRLNDLDVQETYFAKAEQKGTQAYQQAMIEAQRGQELKNIMQKLHERLKEIIK